MNQVKKVDLSTFVVQSDHLLTTELDGETVMMSLERAAYYGLDSTAQRIWTLIHKPRRVSDLYKTLLAEYDIDRETCEQQVCAFLADLIQEGLIRVVEEPI